MRAVEGRTFVNLMNPEFGVISDAKVILSYLCNQPALSHLNARSCCIYTSKISRLTRSRLRQVRRYVVLKRRMRMLRLRMQMRLRLKRQHLLAAATAAAAAVTKAAAPAAAPVVAKVAAPAAPAAVPKAAKAKRCLIRLLRGRMHLQRLMRLVRQSLRRRM